MYENAGDYITTIEARIKESTEAEYNGQVNTPDASTIISLTTENEDLAVSITADMSEKVITHLDAPEDDTYWIDVAWIGGDD